MIILTLTLNYSNMQSLADQIYGYLADDEGARVNKDIPESPRNDQPKAFTYQLAAQTLISIGDTLMSARVVLAWMLAAVGAPIYFIAWLVPVRESLSLLPQLFIAQIIRKQPLRKYFWVFGSVTQGLALLLMLPVITFIDGFWAGLLIVALLAAFSLARGVCSVASKDVLGKTIAKSRRGRLTGAASSIAGFVTLLVALILLIEPRIEASGIALDEGVNVFLYLLGTAAVLWFLAAMVFAHVPEVPEAPEATRGGGNAFTGAIKSLSLLRHDAGLRDFIIARALLVSTSFAIPYLVVLIQQSSKGGIASLGALMLADGAAGLLSGIFWGRMSDSDSNKAMAFATIISVLVMATAVLLFQFAPHLLAALPTGAALLFGAFVAHRGTRIGRQTYLVDMATNDNRASYTAVSNTVIGVFLLLGGGLGYLDVVYGTSTVLSLLCLVATVGVWRCFALKSVSL